MEAFAPSRNAGVMLFDAVCDERATWAAGVFQDTDDNGDIQEDSGYSVTGRVTALPLYRNEGSSLVHVGGAYSYRENNRHDTMNGETARFRARPEAHLLDRLVDTGDFLSDQVQLYGLEAAWVNGPLSVQGEYVWARADINSHANLNGYYVQGSYFLTGEHRNYKTSTGTFNRVKPKANFSAKQGQLGAWEATLRYSSLDLTNNTVTGGELTDITAGLNWHLNPNMRLMFNYIRADKKHMGEADIAILRMQVDF
jgi:phosphate-selective porin OprO/OprP